eukprot:GHVP01002174.1.p1 GENE.GHVP01002174.1~~GHVP01002174.1.p1  ORF type:complete len:1411 (-),score=275.27 GHVP01002174.1:285-4517(-)
MDWGSGPGVHVVKSGQSSVFHSNPVFFIPCSKFMSSANDELRALRAQKEGVKASSLYKDSAKDILVDVDDEGFAHHLKRKKEMREFLDKEESESDGASSGECDDIVDCWETESKQTKDSKKDNKEATRAVDKKRKLVKRDTNQESLTRTMNRMQDQAAARYKPPGQDEFDAMAAFEEDILKTAPQSLPTLITAPQASSHASDAAKRLLAGRKSVGLPRTEFQPRPLKVEPKEVEEEKEVVILDVNNVNGVKRMAKIEVQSPTAKDTDSLGSDEKMLGSGGSSPFEGRSMGTESPKACDIDESISTVKDEINAKVENSLEDTSKKPVFQPLIEDDVCYFYLLDARDENETGTIDLFGQTVITKSPLTTVSTSIHFPSIMRNVFFLLKAQPDKDDTDAVNEEAKKAFIEITELLKKHRIEKTLGKHVYRSMVFPPKFKFENYTPGKKMLFWKCCYSSKYPALPSNIQGETFVQAFHTNLPLLDTLLLKRRIGGPGWLSVKNAVLSQRARTRCALELEIRPPKDEQYFHHKSVSVAGDKAPSNEPQISICAISIKAVKSADQVLPTVVAICLTEHKNCSPTQPNFSNPSETILFVKKTNFEASSSVNGAEIHQFPGETHLLDAFLSDLEKKDPDMLIGHNLLANTLETIRTRINILHLKEWDRLSRLKKLRPSKLGAGTQSAVRTMTLGRLLCDSFKQSQEILKNVRSYDLPSIYESVFGKNPKIIPVSAEDLEKISDDKSIFNKTGLSLIRENNSSLAVIEAIGAVPLTKELASTTNTLWLKSLLAQRSMRNDSFLSLKFKTAKFVIPDSKPSKYSQEPTSPTKKGAAYVGGHVLEPIPGLHRNICFLLDFNSLYPSIIQEYNICFSTCIIPDDENAEVEAPDNSSASGGIIPKTIKSLVERRLMVKKLLASKEAQSSPEKSRTLNSRQLALKLTANSLYGCIGFSGSKYHQRGVAALITRLGRSLLLRAKEKTEGLGYRVIYGDTDSIMVDSNLPDNVEGYQKALLAAEKIKEIVNKQHKYLMIDIENVYSKVLLYKKKKYATKAIVDYPNKQFKTEMKGLDFVRREWCPLVRRLGRSILDFLFDDREPEEMAESIHELLRQTAKQIDENSLPLGDYVLSTVLNKHPSQYQNPKGNGMRHVQVALRMMTERQMTFSPGMNVQFVMGFPTGAAVDGVPVPFHVDEFYSPTGEEMVILDRNFYKVSQLLPPVLRLLCHFEHTDSYRVARCLGIKEEVVAKNQWHLNDPEEEEGNITSTLEGIQGDIKERLSTFKSEFPLPCLSCVFVNDLIRALQHGTCAQCNAKFPEAYIKNQTAIYIHQLCNSLYSYKRMCSNCSTLTRKTIPQPNTCPNCGDNSGSLVCQTTPSKVLEALEALQFADKSEASKQYTSIALQKCAYALIWFCCLNSLLNVL